MTTIGTNVFIRNLSFEDVRYLRTQDRDGDLDITGIDELEDLIFLFEN